MILLLGLLIIASLFLKQKYAFTFERVVWLSLINFKTGFCTVCRSGWPGTYYVALIVLKFAIIPLLQPLKC